MNLRLVVAVLFGALACSAQTASVVGRVQAGSPEAPLAGADVTLSSDGLALHRSTGADGSFAFSALESGRPYRLQIELAGLKSFDQGAIVLNAGQTRRIDVVLSVAERSDAVTVTDYGADGRGGSSEVSQVVASPQLRDLPVLNRSVAKFALLDPHVRTAIGRGADAPDGNRLSINAGSYRNTAYVLDGVNTYDWTYAVSSQQTVPLGSVRELKVLTGNYPAEYGVSTTGILIGTTRSGTNELHGEAFGYLRPSGLQARPPLSPFGVPNERHDWGALAGGAIRANRAWFFANFERGFQERGSLIQSPVRSFFRGTTYDYAALLRADVRLNQNHLLTLRANGGHFTGNDINDRISGFTQPSAGRLATTQSWSGLLTESYTKNRFENQMRLSFTNYVPDSATPLQSSVAVNRPNYAVTGYSTVNWVHVNSWDVGDTAMLALGRQQLHFGAEFMRQTALDFSYTPLGTYTFAAGPPQPGQQPIQYSQTFGIQNVHYGQTVWHGFISDEVRLLPRLSMTAGLRYEYQSITNALRNFAPRLSTSWDVRGDGKTIVRAGAGIFYDQLYMYVSRRFTTLGPAAPTQAITIPFGAAGFPAFPNSLATPAPGSSPGLLNLYVPAPRLLNPYNLQFTFNLQQQVGRATTITVDAQHSHTLRQYRVNDINHPAPFLRTGPNQNRSGSAADATRPLKAFGGVPVRDVAVIENSASSLYDALDLGITRRVSSTFQLAAHYVLSSSASYSMFYADANSGIPNEWNNWGSAERAPSDFYQRHRFSGNAFVRLPLHVDLAVVLLAASGLPVNPITGSDNNGDTYVVDRPVGLGRNSFRGPAEVSIDTALLRQFRFTERFSAEARLESTNVINRNNYLVVNNTYGQGLSPGPTFLAPIAGITNSDPGRQFRFGLRLLF